MKRSWAVGLYTLTFPAILPAYFAKGFGMRVVALLVYACVASLAPWAFFWLVNRMPPEKRLRFLAMDKIYKF